MPGLELGIFSLTARPVEPDGAGAVGEGIGVEKNDLAVKPELNTPQTSSVLPHSKGSDLCMRADRPAR